MLSPLPKLQITTLLLLLATGRLGQSLAAASESNLMQRTDAQIRHVVEELPHHSRFAKRGVVGKVIGEVGGVVVDEVVSGGNKGEGGGKAQKAKQEEEARIAKEKEDKDREDQRIKDEQIRKDREAKAKAEAEWNRLKWLLFYVALPFVIYFMIIPIIRYRALQGDIGQNSWMRKWYWYLPWARWDKRALDVEDEPSEKHKPSHTRHVRTSGQHKPSKPHHPIRHS